MNRLCLSSFILVLFWAFIVIGYANAENSSKFIERDSPYFGQKPPGMISERFAKGIIPVDGVQHCFLTFSPDGKEVFWMNVDLSGEKPKGEIMFMAVINGKWTEPALAPFSGTYNDHAPFFSHDGYRLYFSSTRPGGTENCKNIWYVERIKKGWSKPVWLGSPPNSKLGATQATFTHDGTVYFVGRMDSVQWNSGIYRSKFVNGKYQKPEALSNLINTEHADVYPFIASDESFLLFGSTRPGAKSDETDLYIAFRAENGHLMIQFISGMK